jgi:hypothetical protein
VKIEDLVSYWAILAIFLVSNIPLLLLIFFRAWVFAKLNASVKHEYDAKLEAVKSQLKEQSNETRALLDVSLSGIPQRNAINHKRQLEAIDQLIESFYKAYKMQSLVQTTSTLNMPEMSKRAGDEKTQILAKTFLTGAEDNYVKEDPAWIARPFVSTHAWQYYQAYKNIVTYSYLKLKIISLGVKENDLVYGRIKDLSKLALPDRSAEIDLLPEFGSGWLDILSTLETRLMEAFGLMIAGHSADTQNIESAKDINEQIKLADQFNRANTVVTLSTVSTAIDSDSGLRLNAH